MRTAILVAVTWAQCGLATLEECGNRIAGPLLMAEYYARVANPTDRDRQTKIQNGRWEIPASEIPHSLEAWLAGKLLFRPTFAHLNDRTFKWFCELERGIVDLKEAKRILGRRSARRNIRNAMNTFNLRVRVDHRVPEIIDMLASTPHAVPVFDENHVFQHLKKDPESGRTLYFVSTWLVEEIRAIYLQAYRAGHGHAIGVFATDPEGTETLAAGSFVLVYEGNALMTTAFTAKKIVEDRSPPDAKNPAQRQYYAEALYNGAGHVEEAATLLYLEQLGFNEADTGLVYQGWGMAGYGGRNIPMREFLELQARNRAQGTTFPVSGPDGTDLTPFLTRFAARQGDSP